MRKCKEPAQFSANSAAAVMIIIARNQIVYKRHCTVPVKRKFPFGQEQKADMQDTHICLLVILQIEQKYAMLFGEGCIWSFGC